jgi:hypothetical protein
VYSSAYSDAGDTASIYGRTVSGTGTGHLLAGRNNATPNLETLTDAWQRFDYAMPDEWLHAIDYRSGSGGTPSLGEALIAFPQTEAKSFATSYIPTSGSPVTRSATSCSATFAQLGAPLPAGGVTEAICGQVVLTLLASQANQLALGNSPYPFEIYGDANNRIQLRHNSETAYRLFFFRDGVSTHRTVTTTNVNAGDTIDVRFKHDSLTGVTLWIDGVKHQSTVTGAFTVPLTQVFLGDYEAGNRTGFYAVNKVRLVPEALSDEDIEAWT